MHFLCPLEHIAPENFGHQNQQPQASLEETSDVSSSIPTVLARWEEESAALDGHAAFLCIAALKDRLLEKLVAIYKAESKSSEAANARGSSSGSSNKPLERNLFRTPTGSSSVHHQHDIPSAPHPSDQATPSSPHGMSGVEQLQSSLRAVADALAQTVQVVRTTTQQLRASTSTGGGDGGAVSGPSEEGTQSTAMDTRATEEVEEEEKEDQLTAVANQSMEGEEVEVNSSQVNLEDDYPLQVGSEQSMETSNDLRLSSSGAVDPALVPLLSSSSSGQLQQHSDSSLGGGGDLPTPPPPSAAPSNTILSTFDGSQESARATLASADPEDPLYTFLQAVAGAPAPPLEGPGSQAPRTTATPSITTTASSGGGGSVSQTASTSPRLPVFTQFQSISSSTESHTQSQSQSQSDQQSRSTTTTTTSSSIPVSVICYPSQRTDQVETLPQPDLFPPIVHQPMQDSPTVEQQQHPSPNDLSLSEPTPVPALLPTSTSSLVNSLASQLMRAVSQNLSAASLPPSSSSTEGLDVSLVSRPGSELAPVLSSSGGGRVSASLQSPSPSDTLAPLLLSSLQVAPSSSHSVSTSVDTSSTDAVATGTSAQQSTSSSSSISNNSSAAMGLVMASVPQQIILQPPPPQSTLVVATQLDDEGEAQEEGNSTEETPSSSRHHLTREADNRPSERAVASSSSSDQAQQSSSAAAASAERQSTPEAIDPSFLAALPESIRQEVLAQHEREQQLARTRAHQAREGFGSTISPEFLSALPPNIQEEVSTLWYYMYVQLTA